MENKNILIITEKDANNIFSLLKNYKIFKTDNEDNALQLILNNKIALVLINKFLKDSDLFEFFKNLKTNSSTINIPIVLLRESNYKYNDNFKILNAGILDIINLPVDEEEFLIKIKFYLKFYSLVTKLNNAIINPITQFPNKFSLTEKLKEAFNPRLFLIKIINLPLIYKYYGDLIANEIENYYIKRIKDKIPIELLSSTLIYHIDRGEYAVLIEDNYKTVDKFVLFDICEKFFTQKEEVVVHDKYKFELNIAIGVSQNHHDILLYSEIALNFAIEKKTGYIFAEDIIDKYIFDKQNHIFWINRIKRAIDSDRIVPFFQPIYNNRTKKIEKYEALVRLIDEQGNIRTPFEFLEIAKLENSYFEITKIMINKTFDIFKNREEEVSLNFSFIDIENVLIYHYIFLKLKEMKDMAKRIVLELVEDESIKDYGIVKTFIYEAKQYGAKIAIDDFGSGYSNYKRIFELNVDYVKIDGSLIKDIDTNELSRNIVESIKTFTKKSGIKTIAEYVSNEKIFNIITELDIEYSQGYYIGKPKDLTNKYEENNNI